MKTAKYLSLKYFVLYGITKRSYIYPNCKKNEASLKQKQDKKIMKSKVKWLDGRLIARNLITTIQVKLVQEVTYLPELWLLAINLPSKLLQLFHPVLILKGLHLSYSLDVLV